MDFREKLLRFICEYYRISFQDYDTSVIQICSEEDLANQPMSREHGESYDLYNLNSDFLLFLTDYSKTYTSVLISDFATDLFNRDLTSPLTLSTLHRHQYFELVYVIDGQLDLMIEKVHHRLFSHSACIINPNVRHVEEYTSDFSALYLSMKPEFFYTLTNMHRPLLVSGELQDFFSRNLTDTEDIDYLNFTPVFQNGDKNCERIEKLIFRFLEELLLREAGSAGICRLYIARMFTYFQDPSLYLCANTHFQPLQGKTLFERTVNYLYKHKRKVTREELGKELHYNGNYISHVFQKHTGQTLAEYTRNMCLTEAANLLLNTEMNISEIIHRLGFENKTAFYKQFKKKYHMTPNEYRRSAV